MIYFLFVPGIFGLFLACAVLQIRISQRWRKIAALDTQIIKAMEHTLALKDEELAFKDEELAIVKKNSSEGLRSQRVTIETLMAVIAAEDPRIVDSIESRISDAAFIGNTLINQFEKYALPSFECPICHAVSYNANDVKNSYCGQCHVFTRDEAKP